MRRADTRERISQLEEIRRRTHADGVFRIFDVWETREQGDRFMNEHLNPILEQMMGEAPAGSFTPPKLDTWYDLHDTMP